MVVKGNGHEPNSQKEERKKKEDTRNFTLALYSDPITIFDLHEVNDRSISTTNAIFT